MRMLLALAAATAFTALAVPASADPRPNWDRIENRFDRAENRWDRRENRWDRREDRWDRRH